MLVLRRAPCHASRRITSQICRWIRTSRDPEAEPNPAVTVTKIKYTELPTGRVLPDGSHAAPIGEWLGGLEVTKSLRNDEKPLGSCIHSTQRMYAKTRDPKFSERSRRRSEATSEATLKNTG